MKEEKIIIQIIKGILLSMIVLAIFMAGALVATLCFEGREVERGRFSLEWDWQSDNEVDCLMLWIPTSYSNSTGQNLFCVPEDFFIIKL